MGDIVPFSGSNGKREVEEIEREVRARGRYRMGGRPVPYPLADVEEKIRTLERIEPFLIKKANEELTEQAIAAMETIADEHVAKIAGVKRRYQRGG